MEIKEITTEPEVIYTGSNFLLKVKVEEVWSWNDLEELTWNEAKTYTYSQLKGE